MARAISLVSAVRFLLRRGGGSGRRRGHWHCAGRRAASRRSRRHRCVARRALQLRPPVRRPNEGRLPASARWHAARFVLRGSSAMVVRGHLGGGGRTRGGGQPAPARGSARRSSRGRGGGAALAHVVRRRLGAHDGVELRSGPRSARRRRAAWRRPRCAFPPAAPSRHAPARTAWLRARCPHPWLWCAIKVAVSLKRRVASSSACCISRIIVCCVCRRLSEAFSVSALAESRKLHQAGGRRRRRSS